MNVAKNLLIFAKNCNAAFMEGMQRHVRAYWTSHRLFVYLEIQIGIGLNDHFDRYGVDRIRAFALRLQSLNETNGNTPVIVFLDPLIS